MNTEDFVVGSAWRSFSYSGYIWLILTSQVASCSSYCFGTCLILGQEKERYYTFPNGSIVQWDCLLAWCKGSVRFG